MPSEKPPPTGLIALHDARERAIAQLTDAFAHGHLEVEEFENRLTLAHRADSVADVERTTHDLAPPATALAVAPSVVLAPVNPREDDRMMAIFGGIERHGAWTLPRRLHASAVFGGLLLDLREVHLPPGVTEIHVVAFMGGAQIVVPPNLSVEVSGTAILGGFAHVERAPTQHDPDRPVLRVHGIAVMGGVAVETRLSGESEAEAHRRRQGERRALGPGQRTKRLPQNSGR